MATGYQSRRGQGNFLAIQHQIKHQIKHEVTLRRLNELSMDSILHMARSNCKLLLKTVGSSEGLKDVIPTVFAVIQKLELSFLPGFSSKEDLKKPHQLIERCMDIVQSEVIPKTKALTDKINCDKNDGKVSPVQTEKPSNIPLFLSQTLKCYFTLAKSFFGLTRLSDVEVNVFDASIFRATADRHINSSRALQEKPTARVQAQITNKTTSKKKNRKPRKGASQVSTVQTYEQQRVSLTLTERIEHVLDCENQLENALGALHEHVSSDGENNQYDLSVMISLMDELYVSIDSFISTQVERMPIQHPPEQNPVVPSKQKDSPSEAQNSSARDDDTAGDITESEESDIDDDFDILELLPKPCQPMIYMDPSHELLEAMDR